MNTKRWDRVGRCEIESPAAVEAFLSEYEALCRKHELCLAHEDDGGGFIVERLRNKTISWVKGASLGMLKGCQRAG
jgi:hypothetical protein